MGRHSGTERLLELIRERVRRSGRSHRQLERELDLGHGTLGNILRGRTELRLRHLEVLGRALGFAPADLLAEVYGPPVRVPSAPVLLAMTQDDLRAVVAQALREELVRNGLARPPGEDGEAGSR